MNKVLIHIMTSQILKNKIILIERIYKKEDKLYDFIYTKFQKIQSNFTVTESTFSGNLETGEEVGTGGKEGLPRGMRKL